MNQTQHHRQLHAKLQRASDNDPHAVATARLDRSNDFKNTSAAMIAAFHATGAV